MSTSIYTREYRTMLRLLKSVRENAGVTQVDLSKKLARSQSFVSKDGTREDPVGRDPTAQSMGFP